MRKTVFIVTLSALMFSASLWAQTIAPRCRTCGKKLTECQYKGHHPSKNSSPDKNNTPAKVRPQRHNNSVASKTIQFANGTYTGNIVNGVRVGDGIFKYNNGNIYDGMWKNNKRHGYGTCEYKNGDTYQGSWENDTYNGLGTYFYANRDQLHGEWKNGMMNGHGEYRKTDGTYYEGSFKDNRLDGCGYLISAGDTIVGEFKNDETNGYSYKLKKDGTRVMSMSKDGVPNGFCILDEPNGAVSYLYMKDGKVDGPAIVIMPNKTICGVVYSHSKVVSSNTHKIQNVKQTYYDLGAPDLSNIRAKQTDTKFGEIIWSNGVIYVGDLRNGMPHGFGIMVYKNKDVYIGNIENGLTEGQGAYVYFKDGECDFGSWHEGKRNGLFTTVSTVLRSVNKVMWKDDIIVH